MVNKQLDAWSGEFGDAYTDRNTVNWLTRLTAWQEMTGDLTLSQVLEVGCNRGHNLQCLAEIFPQAIIAGIEPNARSLAGSTYDKRNIATVNCAVYETPYPDASFDLVFTAAVLIHIPAESLGQALATIYRLSRRYILAVEFFEESETEIEYRGRKELLWKRDFLKEYQSRFPDLTLVKSGYFTKEQGFDRCHWWLLEK